jgi:hypothetical protein
MESKAGLASAVMFFAVVTGLACWLSAFPTIANAQGQGQNTVCTSTVGCSTSVGTYAFIDASVFATSPPPSNQNFCGVLNFVLANIDQPPHYPSGAVIDARGLNSTNTSMTCTFSPWAGITSPPPSTILLPAGTIVIQVGWVLPSNTHLFGQGDNIASGTVIQACTPSTCPSGISAPPMIQFGSSTCSAISCPGVSVEKLILDGKGLTISVSGISGLVNQYSSTSYVDHVSLYQILGTGLSISGSASNSGPYRFSLAEDDISGPGL